MMIEEKDEFLLLQLKIICKSHIKWQKEWLAKRNKILGKYSNIFFQLTRTTLWVKSSNAIVKSIKLKQSKFTKNKTSKLAKNNRD